VVMPETSWEKLDPRAPVARAADFVNRIGPGWTAAQGRVDAADGTWHQPLPVAVPIARDAREVRPEPPPVPSELELRDQLKTSLAAEQEARIPGRANRPGASACRRSGPATPAGTGGLRRSGRTLPRPL
jgi:hypothetical protein